MSESQADPIDVSQFKNGDDVHFDYSVNSNDPSINTTNANKKKKKKKSKNKSKGSPNVEVTLNDPDVEYPTSRVIKQAPNGDVIIESLDEPTETHAKSLSANIWDNSTLEEQENLKEFWESLDEAQKMELVKIDKKSVMDIFKNEAKTAGTQNGHQNNGNVQGGQGHLSGGNGSLSNGSSNSNGACTCTYCGRRNNFIEDELENIYDNHFDDIIDFIHEVRDINDINALPGLLFGGFHMLEEEHRLQKRQQRYKYEHEKENQIKEVDSSQSEGANADQTSPKQEDGCAHESVHDHGDESEQDSVHSHSHSHIHNYNQNDIDSHNHNHNNHNHSHSHFHYNQIEELNDDEELAQQSTMSKSLEDVPTSEIEDINDQLLETKEQKIFHKLLDPKLFEALENLDFEKIKSTPDNYQQNILEKAGSLRDIIRDLHKADKVELEKGMTFLENMGKILSGDVNNSADQNKRSAQLSQGLSNFAEDLLKNDGNSFIDMMESLSESRTAREDLLKEKFESDPSAAWIDEDDKAKITKAEMPIQRPDLHQIQTIEEELKGEYEEEEEEEEEEEDDLEDEEFEEEDGEASDTESEISEEEKMQEIRRLFLIQVIKLFQERLKNAYKEKLSQDRTKMLIEELEAEENAKKEKEMKKLKQKEKAKEKKRLQQLAKEEERRKKEEEQKAKEEELKQKQEALKAEQKRKKEEAKQRREEEKRKRIEELKRKELEHQKKLEAQRKKEEETKKLKEERKKKAEEERKQKAEEERKQKEEERKQKELQKKLAEEELAKSVKEDRAQEDMKQMSGLDNSEFDPALGVHIPTTKPDAILQQAKEPKVVSPKKNHILDQLYQAKPRSLSSSTGSTPTINHAGPVYQRNDLPSNLVPSVLSPSTNNILPNSASSNQAPSPWSSQQAFNNNSQPSVYQPQFASHTFSPFNSTFSQNNFSNNASENVNPNPLSSAGFNEPFPTSAQQPSVWNPAATSRNNSIWSNSPSVSSNPTLWSNPVAPSSVGGVGVAAPNPPISNTANIDSDLVQTAAYQAFNFLQSSNQLEFGVAPSLILFQTAKTILANQALTLNQFLTCCRNTGSLSGYIFDFIYDDFGTVTHIKVSSTNITGQPLQKNLSTQSMNNMGLGNVPNGNESLLNSLGDLGNNLNAFSNGSRGLWN